MKQSEHPSINLSACLFLTAVGLLFWLLNFLTPVTLSDDILYRFQWQPDENAAKLFINSFSDFIHSQVVHYQYITGRSLIQALAQLFIAIIGKGPYNIVNSLVFVALIATMSTYITRGRNTLLSLSAVTFALFILIPGFANEFLWFVAGFNYPWVALAIFIFWLFFRKMKDRKTTPSIWLWSTLALLAGWSHEGIALPVSVALVVYLIRNRRHIAHSAVLPMSIFFILGTLLCVFAPSTIHRSGIDSHIGMQWLLQKGTTAAVAFSQLRATYVLAAVAIVFSIKKKIALQEHLHDNTYLYITLLAALFIVALCGMTETRALFFTELLAIILLLDLLLTKCSWRHQRVASIVLCVMMLAVYIPALALSVRNYHNSQAILSQLKDPKTTLIKVPQIKHLDNDYQKYIFKNYVREAIRFGIFEQAQGFDPQNEYVRSAEVWYHKSPLYFLPEDLLDSITHHPQAFRKPFTNPGHELIALQTSKGQVTDVQFQLRNENVDTLSIAQWLVAYKGNTYQLPADKFGILTIGGRNYLIMDCPTTNIRRRIVHIMYE
jgi:hypothetical protein